MSQMVTRKGPVGEDKEKVQADTPVKEMKKKMAANAEKEKQAAEKDKTVEKLPEKSKAADKQPEKVKPAEKQPEKAKPAEKQPEKAKPAEKQHPEKAKPAEKQQLEKAKPAEKQPEKVKPAEKQPEKTKPAEKQPEKVKPTEKQAEKEKERGEKTVEKKNDAPAEKPKEDNIKPDKLDDKEKDKPKRSQTDTPTPTPQKSSKQNGARPNGVPENGCGGEHSDATVSSDDERDDMFPELAYDDSDGEFEPPTPEGLPSRSYTRRSQAKATRTPETPRPASDRRADRADRDADDSKESKVLKLKDDGMATDRKLRSSDSPKPESRKPGEKEKEKEKEASPRKKDLEVSEREEKDKSTVEIVIDLDGDDEPAEGPARGKADTNYSRSRVKVSPYRRGGRVAPAAADVTATSLLANYTGNNTTMEMDITETSSLVGEEAGPGAEAMDGSPYLSAIRNMRGRRSYRPLREMALRGVCGGRGARSPAALPVTDQPSRPTAPVVGRKRKPEGDTSVELGSEAHEAEEAARGKRARLLEKLARPFRTVATASLPVRRNAEIVGINTDLPLTAPVAAPETFDPETLKTSAPNVVVTPPSPIPTPEHEREGKRCTIM